MVAHAAVDGHLVGRGRDDRRGGEQRPASTGAQIRRPAARPGRQAAEQPEPQQHERQRAPVLSGHRLVRPLPSRWRGEPGDELVGPAALDDAGGLRPLADGGLADAEPLADLGVRQALGDQVGDLPAAAGPAGQHRGPQPDRGLERPGGGVVADDAGVPGAVLGGGHRRPRVEVRRAAPGAGVVGERLLDRADPDADVPGVGAQQPLDGVGHGGAVVEHALELVADGALEAGPGRHVGERRRASRGSGPGRSGSRAGPR